MYTLDTEIITIPINLEAKRLADEFASEQLTVEKGRRVYFNTLAVYAVHCYLKWLQIPTELEESESWNPILHSAYDVADLVIPNIGKLECRPIFIDELQGVINIPIEARKERIGCVVVLFRDTQLNEVEILGFVPSLDANILLGVIQLKDLRAIEDLIDHLEEIESTSELSQEFAKVRISKDWLRNKFSEAWRTEQELIAGRRGGNERLAGEISRVKLINIAENIVALLVSVTSETDNELNILFRLYPAGQAFTLPSGLKLSIFDDEDGELLEEEEAGQSSNYIQIELSEAEPGYCMSVQISLGDVSYTEHFEV